MEQRQWELSSAPPLCSLLSSPKCFLPYRVTGNTLCIAECPVPWVKQNLKLTLPWEGRRVPGDSSFRQEAGLQEGSSDLFPNLSSNTNFPALLLRLHP